MTLDYYGVILVTDRIGPISILPPELDPVVPDRDIDYTLSDVYLFAKIVWMLIKKDTYGFKGPYLRNRQLFYLDPKEYKVSTLEPIQQLLERATEDDIGNRRIDMEECIRLLEEQINVIRFERSPDIYKKQKIQ